MRFQDTTWLGYLSLFDYFFDGLNVATYLVGDLQGCNDAFGRLLQLIDFSPSRDNLYLLGDLVNRGPDSAGTLRRCMAMSGSVHALLGNHDLHLLASAYHVRKSSKRDTLHSVLQADDCAALLDWVRHQPLARHLQDAQGQDLLLVHAGVLPQWTLTQTLALADEVHAQLRGPDLLGFLLHMYGNTPDHWRDDLAGPDRLRVIVNALTRIRFCDAQGKMDFDSAEAAESAPEGLMPWFDCPNRQTAATTMAFGHWSTLGLRNTPELMALDTGCLWGGCLSAMQLNPTDFQQRQLFQVHCPQAQKPGK